MVIHELSRLKHFGNEYNNNGPISLRLLLVITFARHILKRYYYGLQQNYIKKHKIHLKYRWRFIRYQWTLLGFSTSDMIFWSLQPNYIRREVFSASQNHRLRREQGKSQIFHEILFLNFTRYYQWLPFHIVKDIFESIKFIIFNLHNSQARYFINSPCWSSGQLDSLFDLVFEVA